MKIFKALWVGLLMPALSLWLIYTLGYWWVWAGGLLTGLALGFAVTYTLSKEFKT